MFRAATDPQFTHRVDVMVPITDGHERQSFRATFRVLGDDEQPDLTTVAGTTAFLRQVLIGWDELVNDDDQPLPFSAEARDGLLRLPYVQAALTRTYVRAVSKEAVGN